jgi:cytoskeleton protein RodZ
MKAGFVTVGETLSHARRTRGLSVDDVAIDTCIRATLIRAIEADDFSLCGGEVYARGHIRSIARVVGVDPEPLIGEHDTARGATRVVSAVVPQPTDRSIVARAERRQPNWTIAMAAALVVICGIALVGLLQDHGSAGKRPGTASTNAGQQSQSKTQGQTPTTPKPRSSPPSSSVAQLPASQATLKVRTLRGQTWLSITTKAGKTLFSGLLADGQQKIFTSHHSLAYVIGNAPAVDIVVNGNDIGTPPASGAVARGNVKPGADTVQQA